MPNAVGNMRTEREKDTHTAAEELSHEGPVNRRAQAAVASALRTGMSPSSRRTHPQPCPALPSFVWSGRSPSPRWTLFPLSEIFSPRLVPLSTAHHLPDSDIADALSASEAHLAPAFAFWTRAVASVCGRRCDELLGGITGRGDGFLQRRGWCPSWR